MLRQLVLALLVAQSWQQGMLLDLHPAAIPHDIAENLGFVERNEGMRDALLLENMDMGLLVDPEGKPIDEPQKAHSMLIEEELRREAAEIQRILSGKSVEASREVGLSTWLWTLFGCSLVVSCGVIPAFLLPANTHNYFSSEEGKRNLNKLLSFAVGSLLGDVFLHLLPEAYSSNEDHVTIGLWILAGLLTFSFVEKLGATNEESHHQLTAIMNLAANVVDNFTHGLAVGGSFLVSPKFGIMTTITILVHEVPHEVSDFAILLRADYDRVAAMKAQFITASAGILGACGALWLHTSNFPVVEALLPFTAGGFLNIALTQILPELNEETSSRQNLRQLVFVMAGVLSMTAMNLIAF
ncbi:unnamed protein product [Caenorhabditis auriculariae]|uniref:Uncharacterized protein n=1 Tax=Caenorhabditis auriculariae TaxID=2777116 RepID=A0A8S1GP03_9PELO|nr:unnamed protein product [Caenorhabditis auriculariae]